MSSINVYCDEVSWGKVFPGVHLVQAINVLEKPYKANNGVLLREGRFGLTFSNDPSFAFSVTPVKDSLFELPDSELEKALDKIHDKKLAREYKIHHIIHKELKGDIAEVSKLYNILVKSGYNSDVHGYVGVYLSHKMAVFIEQNKHKPKRVYQRI